MKKTYYSFFFILLSFSLNAQVRVGIKAGYNNSNGIYDQQNDISKGKSISGFQVGVFAEKKISGSSIINPNLLFTQKGNYANYTDKHFPQDHFDVRTYRLNYLEADIAIVYKLSIGENWGVKIGIGPYAAFGLSGKETGYFNWFGNSGTIDREIKFTNTKADHFNQTNFSPFEWGVNFKTGIEYKKYMLYMNYGSGVGSRVSGKYAGNTSGNDFGYYEANTKNRVLSIGIGYAFDLNKRGKGCFTE